MVCITARAGEKEGARVKLRLTYELMLEFVDTV